MKQKKLLVWGIVLACVMLLTDLLQGYAYAGFYMLVVTLLMPAAVCGILAGAVCRKRVLGIIGSSVMLIFETVALVSFMRYISDVSMLLSLAFRLIYLTMAVLWFLRFVLNRSMKTLLIVVAIVGAALSGMIESVNMVKEVASIVNGYGNVGRLLNDSIYILSALSFWTVLLLAACGQPKTAAEPVLEAAETCAEEVIESAVETVSAAEEEIMPAQEEPVPSESALDALERLAKLHERGILTDAEFESKKAELLSKI